MYVLGAQKNRLIETVLLSTHNMYRIDPHFQRKMFQECNFN